MFVEEPGYTGSVNYFIFFWLHGQATLSSTILVQDKGVERFQHNSQNMTGLLDSTIEPTIGVNGDISNLSDTSVL